MNIYYVMFCLAHLLVNSEVVDHAGIRAYSVLASWGYRMRGRAGRTLSLLGLQNVRRQSRSDSRPLGVTECEAEQVGL